MKKTRGFKAVFLLFATIMIFTSCGPKIDDPETVVNKALTAIKTLDYETASTYFNSDDFQVDETTSEDQGLNDETISKLFESIQYEIVSSEVSDTTATVNATIKAINMSAVISDYVSEAMLYIFSDLTEEELNTKYNEILLNSMNKNAENLIEKNVDISLTKSDTGWLIDVNDSLLDAITGGTYSLTQSFNIE